MEAVMEVRIKGLSLNSISGALVQMHMEGVPSWADVRIRHLVWSEANGVEEAIVIATWDDDEARALADQAASASASASAEEAYGKYLAGEL